MDKSCRFGEIIQLTMNPIHQKNIFMADSAALGAFNFELGIGQL
ncbi:hypothetical protein [Desulfosporosinus hippei]|uniref:Uncharacterized protein n=1 Tax=Desulfosporosinus hippei DSM 8344 TaxID=1121419 RepID=A0A1G8AJ79_9FIRM|nr:hypothetical protein [Desulfosporosinus hippei]SDH20939.1 hypothetical protein SAMN05443529_11121 [Desulfosporosinus hippei DSM 8344]